MKSKISKNIKTVLDFLQDEVKGGVSAKNVHKDYFLTGMYADKENKKIFPTPSKQGRAEADLFQDRVFEVKNIAEGQNVVIVEAVQSCYVPKTKKTYRAPVVLIFEMQKGKIVTGRHYFDPFLLLKALKSSQIEKGFKKSKGNLLIIK